MCMHCRVQRRSAGEVLGTQDATNSINGTIHSLQQAGEALLGQPHLSIAKQRTDNLSIFYVLFEFRAIKPNTSALALACIL